jgi:transcriptional regulator with XRE-family HTH domain
MDTAAFDLELGQSIRDRLQAHEITLSDAAEATGIPFSTLWRHLNRGGLTVRELHALAGVLDTSASELTALAVA